MSTNDLDTRDSLTRSPRWLVVRDWWLRIKEGWPEVSTTGTWMLIALVTSIVLSFLHSPIAPLPGVISLFLLPGATVLAILKTRPANTAGRLVLAVCLSMMVIMVEGGVVSLLGPHIGIAHPLNVIPQSVIWILLALVILVIGAMKRRDPAKWILEGVRSDQILVLLGCGLLVVISILGVAQLNHSGNAHLAVVGTVLDVVALLAAVVGGWKRSSRWPLSSILYAASLALLVSTSLRGGHLYGWDIQQEFGNALLTARAGVWVIPADHDPYASMLSLTVLPVVLHSVAKLRLLAFFQLVIPAILALLPVAVFSTVRRVPRWITSGRLVPRPGLALAVVVGLIVSSVAFSSELVSITRQAMAMTMLTALVMVLFDRTVSKRSAQIVVCLLIVTISFTHYTTSYLLAGIFLCAWVVSLLWSKGWLGTPRAKIEQHRYHARSRKIINGALVCVALGSALGWNLAITRNSALSAPSSAVAASGVGIGGSTLSAILPPREFEKILTEELQKTDSFLVPVPHANAVHLKAATLPSSPGVVPSLVKLWNKVSYYVVESLWIVLGLSLLYGLLRLSRRRSYEYSADLVGLAVTGLLIGAFLRFSGTLASFYNPERAAILTAILLAAPATLFLEDVVTRFATVARKYPRTAWIASGVGVAYIVVLVIGATGLGSLFFGGPAPGSLSAGDVNVQEFAVSTPELATAVWLSQHVRYPSIVQTDLYGQLVMLSEPGDVDPIAEIVPPDVDQQAYIYLSTVNLDDGITQASADNLAFVSAYRSTLPFFNHNFYVVYSSGVTRVYH
ncbi:MAG: hypothetical protein WA860_01320 [Acidimicrobiales bacterium]